MFPFSPIPAPPAATRAQAQLALYGDLSKLMSNAFLQLWEAQMQLGAAAFATFRLPGWPLPSAERPPAPLRCTPGMPDRAAATAARDDAADGPDDQADLDAAGEAMHAEGHVQNVVAQPGQHD